MDVKNQHFSQNKSSQDKVVLINEYIAVVLVNKSIYSTILDRKMKIYKCNLTICVYSTLDRKKYVQKKRLQITSQLEQLLFQILAKNRAVGSIL